MFRFITLAFTLVICFASFGCQTYSTGLEKSMARANETGAIGALHAISQAQQIYSVSNEGNYGSLQQLSDAGYLDERFKTADGGVKDYVLTLVTEPRSSGKPASYTCNADPKEGPLAGRHFYVDSSSSVIHVNATQAATKDDPAHQP